MSDEEFGQLEQPEQLPAPRKIPARKGKAKAKAKAEPAARTIGVNRFGTDEVKPQTDRRAVELYELKPNVMTDGTVFELASKSVPMSPSLLLGVRLDPRQMLEYMHLMDPDLVPSPDFPPQTEEQRLRPWEYVWNSSERMDQVYGTKIPTTQQLMEYFLRVVPTESNLSMIVDGYGYVYLGYMPQPYASQDGYRGYLQFPYTVMHRLNIQQMETLQRIIYRIPLHNRLSDEAAKKLQELRMGGRNKYPDYYLVTDMTSVARYTYLEMHP